MIKYTLKHACASRVIKISNRITIPWNFDNKPDNKPDNKILKFGTISFLT